MNVGERIKAARKKANLTQAQLAQLCGVATITIRQYEADKREPKLEQLWKIAGALGVRLDDLLGGIETFDSGEEFEKRRKELLEKSGAGGDTLTLSYTSDPRVFIDSTLDLLNDEGQQKAAERVAELTWIPRYRKDAPDDQTPKGEG